MEIVLLADGAWPGAGGVLSRPARAPARRAARPRQRRRAELPSQRAATPRTAPADCAYGGEFSQIKAVDELTVEFDLCYPDPAFLSKIAFIANGIQDSDYLEANMVNHLILAKPNGTGPVQVRPVRSGRPRLAGPQRQLLGRQGLAPRSSTSSGTPRPRRGCSRFRPARSMASTTLVPTTSRPSRATPTSSCTTAKPLNTMYVGMTNTFAPFDNPKVRQALAQGIDRQRIVDNFYPGGLDGRRLLHAVQHRRSAARATRGTTSTRTRPTRCSTEALACRTVQHQDLLPRRGSWLPARPERGGPGAAEAASGQPRHHRRRSRSRSRGPSSTTPRPDCSTASTCLAGARTIPTRPTSSTTTSTTPATCSSARSTLRSPSRSKTGAQTLDDDARAGGLRRGQQRDQGVRSR